jgi:ankyrin repeat protein
MEKNATIPPGEIWKMRDSKGQTPLFSIAPFLNETLLNFLRLRNVDFAAVDNNQQSALYFAFYSEAVEILAKLCPLDQVDRFGRSPLAHCINKGVSEFNAGAQIYYDIALKLIEAGANPDQRCLEEAFHGNRSTSRSLALRLLEKGEYDERGVTKLGLAVKLQLPDQIKGLIVQGENPNWKHKGSHFSLLEMTAMNSRDILSFYYLLEGGALPEEPLAAPPFYQYLANIYRREYASADVRHAAIRQYLTDPTKMDPRLKNTDDYQILCREMNIYLREKREIAPHQITPSHQQCTLL